MLAQIEREMLIKKGVLRETPTASPQAPTEDAGKAGKPSAAAAPPGRPELSAKAPSTEPDRSAAAARPRPRA